MVTKLGKLMSVLLFGTKYLIWLACNGEIFTLNFYIQSGIKSYKTSRKFKTFGKFNC